MSLLFAFPTNTGIQINQYFRYFIVLITVFMKPYTGSCCQFYINIKTIQVHSIITRSDTLRIPIKQRICTAIFMTMLTSSESYITREGQQYHIAQVTYSCTTKVLMGK